MEEKKKYYIMVIHGSLRIFLEEPKTEDRPIYNTEGTEIGTQEVVISKGKSIYISNSIRDSRPEQQMYINTIPGYKRQARLQYTLPEQFELTFEEAIIVHKALVKNKSENDCDFDMFVITDFKPRKKVKKSEKNEPVKAKGK